MMGDEEMPTTFHRIVGRVKAAASVALAWLLTTVWTTKAIEPVDERGGGRNSDEGFHIAGGALIAGAIVAGVAAFVANKLGALK
jgi:hypothetical protein